MGVDGEPMKKKDAIIKARQGMTAGDLREILNNAQEFASRIQASKVNPALTRREVWEILQGGISNLRELEIVDTAIATNILREFAPDEIECMTPVSNGVIPF